MYPPPSATPLQRLCANFVRAGRRVKAVHSSLHPGGGNAGCRPGLLHAGPALQVLQRLTPATAEKDPPRAPKALYRVFPIYISPSCVFVCVHLRTGTFLVGRPSHTCVCRVGTPPVR